MRKTKTIEVGKVANVNIEKAKNIILNPNRYKGWWKDYNLQHNEHNETLHFEPLKFIRIKLHFVEKGDDFIKFNYIEGPFHGTGIWKLKKVEPDKTYISYTITISGGNWWMNVIKSTPFFKWKHKRDIIKLINLIEEQVS